MANTVCWVFLPVRQSANICAAVSDKPNVSSNSRYGISPASRVIFDPWNSSFSTAVKPYANGILAAFTHWILQFCCP